MTEGKELAMTEGFTLTLILSRRGRGELEWRLPRFARNDKEIVTPLARNGHNSQKKLLFLYSCENILTLFPSISQCFISLFAVFLRI